MIKNALSAITLALALLSAGAACADDYPSKPIQLIVPFSPGTAVDLVGRLLSVPLSVALKTPVIVENRMGAASQIGAQIVAKAKPDGYTLLFTSPAHYINRSLYKTLPFDPIKDFSPIVRMSDTLLVLVVPKSSPVNSVKELIDYARARPGQLNYSSAGNGSTTHLPAALFNSMAGLDIVHVPYKSGAQALTDVMGNQVFMTFTAPATALPHVKAGTLKALAVTGSRRSASMPDVPTLAEAGVPGYEFSSWNGMLAPAGTPEAIIAKLESALLEISKSPEFKAKVLAGGAEPEAMSRSAFMARLKEEIPMWEKMVAISGAKPE